MKHVRGMISFTYQLTRNGGVFIQTWSEWIMSHAPHMIFQIRCIVAQHVLIVDVPCLTACIPAAVPAIPITYSTLIGVVYRRTPVPTPVPSLLGTLPQVVLFSHIRGRLYFACLFRWMGGWIDGSIQFIFCWKAFSQCLRDRSQDPYGKQSKEIGDINEIKETPRSNRIWT